MAISNRKTLLIVDVLCLQVAWFIAAYLHDHATVWLLLIMVFRLIVAQDNSAQIIAACKIAAIGLLLEFALIQMSIYRYSSALLVPLWLPMLWMLFGFALINSMRWIGAMSWHLQALIGAVAGTLTYRGAAALDVLEPLASQLMFLMILALTWSIALPTFFYQSQKHCSGEIR